MGLCSDNAPALTMPGRKTLPDPFTLVIFGASGDLTRRKLVPAVYSLCCEGLLPDRFDVVGFARRDKTDASFRAEMRDAVNTFSRARPVSDEAWSSFSKSLHSVSYTHLTLPTN